MFGSVTPHEHETPLAVDWRNLDDGEAPLAADRKGSTGKAEAPGEPGDERDEGEDKEKGEQETRVEVEGHQRAAGFP